MNSAPTDLPPELVEEALFVMGRAFVAIRSATSQNYSLGVRLSPERVAALGMLADALHNVPEWIRPEADRRWRTDAKTVRVELDVAIGAIEFLHGRGPFVSRGPFRPDLIHRIMPHAPSPMNDPTMRVPAEMPPRRSWFGSVVAACRSIVSRKARPLR